MDIYRNSMEIGGNTIELIFVEIQSIYDRNLWKYNRN